MKVNKSNILVEDDNPKKSVNNLLTKDGTIKAPLSVTY